MLIWISEGQITNDIRNVLNLQWQWRGGDAYPNGIIFGSNGLSMPSELWKAHSYSVGGDALAILVTWLSRESGEYMERFTRLASSAAARKHRVIALIGNSNKSDIDGNRIQNRDRATEMNKVVMTGSHEYKGREGLSQAKQKQNMPTDFARLPPTTGRVYATTRDQAAKTSVTRDVGEWLSLDPVLHCGGAPSYLVKTMMGAVACVINYRELNQQDVSKTAFRTVMPLRILGYALLSEKSMNNIYDCFWNLRQKKLYAKFRSASLWIQQVLSLRLLNDVLLRVCFSRDSLTSTQLEKERVRSCVWTDERHESFEELKRRLGVCSDIDSFIRQLKPYEVNYPTHDLELAADGFALKIWRHLSIKDAQSDDGELWLLCRMYFGEEVDDEAHSSPFYYSTMYNKMYERFETVLLVERMKQDVAKFDDAISMDFITVLPTTRKEHDAIWWFRSLTKSAPFLTIQRTISEVLRLVLKGYTEKLELVLSSVQHFIHKPMSVRENHSDFGRYVTGLCFGWTGSWDNICAGRCPELIEITNEKVAVAKEKLKEARSRQKSYADKHRRGLRIFKLEIYLERIGEVLYRLALPRIIIQPDMSLSEEPESILDRQERVMRNKVIPFVKILWKNHPEREATWETEESMRASYPPTISMSSSVKECGKNSGKLGECLVRF
ncbi:hypothetical protein Tco_0646622 [Tanacetum coccineum]